MPSYLLQSEYWKQDDPTGAIVVGIVVAAGVLVLFIYKAIKGDFKKSAHPAPRRGSQGQMTTPSKFHGGAFKRAARNAGLDESQVAFVTEYGKRLQTANPDFVFQNPSAMDSFLKKIYREIESHVESEEQAEEKKTLLFSIHSFFDGKASSESSIKSTRRIPNGMVFSFLSPADEHFPSKIVAVEADAMLVEAPTNSMGSEVRFPRGTKLHCYFYSISRQGFSFDTRVLGYRTHELRSLLCLSHTDHVASLPNRQYRRKRLSQDCVFNPVKIVVSNEKRKEVRKPIVQKRTIPGTIEDISAGGMSIKTANPLAQNEYLKIDFEIPKGSGSVFAKVVRLERQAIGGVMHLQFVKMSRKTLISIYNIVYGYED
jgi:c-di-GMP-binding flagellar brake protein YcgR